MATRSSVTELAIILASLVIVVLVLTEASGIPISIFTGGISSNTNDFALAATPYSCPGVDEPCVVNVQTSDSFYTVSANANFKSGQTVRLSVTGCPASSICSISPKQGTTPFNSTLLVKTSTSTPGGRYHISIIGEGPTGINKLDVELVVLQIA